MSRPVPRAARTLLGLPLAVLFVLTACAGTSSDAEVAAGVPEGLVSYYTQELDWGGCADFATTPVAERVFAQHPDLQCTRLTVPLDYSDPDGETASIAVLRRPAGNPDRRIGSLVINPGGPGASGIVAAASLAGKVQGTELGRRFDLVGFDPRGVGASRPKIQCLTGPERDAWRLDTDLKATPAAIEQTEAEAMMFARKCAQRSGTELLANVGTRDVARDMDILRAALGDEKLTYLGYSYGTALGTEYAEQFTDNVRAMILDGAIDPDAPLVKTVVRQAAGFQDAFDAFIDWCLERENCWTDGPASKANEQYQRLLDPLIQQPLPVGPNRKLSYPMAITGTIQALYDDKLWPYLNLGLTELRAGKGRVLLELADIYAGRTPNGTYSGVQDAFTAIHCVDEPPVTDRDVLRKADRRYAEAAPFLDAGYPPSGARGACAFWPVPPTDRPSEPHVPGLPTVLVISTTGDPATPYQAGVDLAKALDARLLTYEGNQHTVFLQDVQCVNRIGINYLVNLELPPKGARCS